MTDTAARCARCGRTGQMLVTECEPGHVSARLVCHDEDDCSHYRALQLGGPSGLQAEAPGTAPHSTYRAAARQAIADAQAARRQPGADAQVHATCAVAWALLAVADAIGQEPGSDLASVLNELAYAAAARTARSL